MKTKINLHSNKIGKFIIKRNILTVLIVLSIISLIATPKSVIERGVAENIAWIGYGTLITESFFITGLGIMAYEVGHALGKNPLVWRGKLSHILHKIVKTKLFWFGFWINAVGALGTTILISIGLIRVLPPQSWVLLWLPLADIGLTIAVRFAAIYAAKDLR